MREILFRGKRKDNGEWVQGCLIHKTSSVGNKTLSLIVCSAEWDDESEFFHLCNTHLVIPETIGQYTGLTDKNGTKIFEGDILNEKPPMNQIGFRGSVVWDDDLVLWRLKFDDNPSYLAVLGTYSRSYTVVGNIFDTPELLKSGDK